MQPKPSHLSGEYGAWFKDPVIADAYPARPPYPEAAIRQLAALVVDEPRVVLDVGAGTGDLARRLAPLVERVDAVDFSRAMLDKGRLAPGGDAPNIRWIEGAVEDASLAAEYALVTAGESLHWMAWDVVIPRFARVLSAHGALALVDRSWEGTAVLRERMLPIYARYSAVRDYRPFTLADELERRGLFRRLGETRFGPDPWQPTLDEYLTCRHSQRGFSRTHMGPQAAADFDAAVGGVLAELCAQGVIAQQDGRLQLSVEATVVWGQPL